MVTITRISAVCLLVFDYGGGMVSNLGKVHLVIGCAACLAAVLGAVGREHPPSRKEIRQAVASPVLAIVVLKEKRQRR